MEKRLLLFLSTMTGRRNTSVFYVAQLQKCYLPIPSRGFCWQREDVTRTWIMESLLCFGGGNHCSVSKLSCFCLKTVCVLIQETMNNIHKTIHCSLWFSHLLHFQNWHVSKIAAFQAATVLVAMASRKNIWRLKLQGKSPIWRLVFGGHVPNCSVFFS